MNYYVCMHIIGQFKWSRLLIVHLLKEHPPSTSITNREFPLSNKDVVRHTIQNYANYTAAQWFTLLNNGYVPVYLAVSVPKKNTNCGTFVVIRTPPGKATDVYTPGQKCLNVATCSMFLH